ncbi:MAG: cob(I)yrinic acid a,c-diamide adenosyltransferase [Treponema sp.]|nr:cob(I)yrinic acid a,c-diamide adenosyltransferase [Treponema sp.]
MSISTRLGDDGTTEIRGGKRFPKDHPRIECLGALDELNAFVGNARCALGRERSGTILERVQRELGTIAGILALPAPAETGAAGAAGAEPAPEIDETWIDDWIRVFEGEVPFRGFVLPGSNPVSAKLDMARTVCRRAERRLVTLHRLEGTPPSILRYLNRLSDLLFLLARAA